MIKQEIYEKGIAADLIKTMIPKAPSKEKTKIALISVGISIHMDWKQACDAHKLMLEKTNAMLEPEKYELIYPQEPFEDHNLLKKFLDDAAYQGIDGIILYHAAYTTGEVASTLGLWLLEHKLPIFSYAMPEQTGANLQANRLCCQNFILSILGGLGVKYHWLFCPPNDVRFEEHMQRFCRISRAIGRIKGKKALIAGASRVPGFYDCEINELAVLKRFGLGFDRVNLLEITSYMDDFSADQIEEIKNAIFNHKDYAFNNVPNDQTERTIRLALAMMHYVRKGDYFGTSFKNWPELFDHFQVSGDGVMSLMNDQDMTVSDEGDTGGLISMIVLRELRDSLSVPMLADISFYDEVANKLGIWHNSSAATCLKKKGSPFECRRHGVLENYDFETAWGMLFEFLIEPGPVTVLRYKSPDMASSLAFEGDVVASDMKFRGVYGELIPRQYTASQIIHSIMSKGLDHHWLVGRGHFLADIHLFNYWLDIKNTIPTQDQPFGIGV